MAGFFDSLYTPQELAAMKARLDPVTPYHQGIGIGLNVAQNLSPASGAGFLLGNILGNRINNYLDTQRAARADRIYQDYQGRYKNYLANPSQPPQYFPMQQQAVQNQGVGTLPQMQPQYNFTPPNSVTNPYTPTPNQYTFQPAQMTTNNPYNLKFNQNNSLFNRNFYNRTW